MSDLMSGRLSFVATAIEPIHHGAGAVGNTQILRVQEIMLPDGTTTRVPFISGNSFKHLIREGGAMFAIGAMGVKAGTLTKPVVDLLFSGGHLSKSGSAVNLGTARKIAELFPVLSLCGYSAGNFMQSSKIVVDHLNLVCSENTFRMPENVAQKLPAKLRAAAFRGEEFGTRHEATRNPSVDKLLVASERASREKLLKGKLETGDKSKGGSSQMLYEFEVLMPGTVFYGGLYFDDLTALEMAALRSALEYQSMGKHADGGLVYRLGGKGSVGFGRVSVVFDGGLRETISPPSFSPNEGIMPMGKDADKDAMAAYVEHLRKNKNEIISCLEEVV